MSENTKKNDNKYITEFNDLCNTIEIFHIESKDFLNSLNNTLNKGELKFNFDLFHILKHDDKLLFLNSIYLANKEKYENFITSYSIYLSILNK